MQTPFSREVELGSLKTSDINPNLPQVTVQAVLCWSEYYNGKWQPPKTSDVNNPVSLDTSSPSVFDRSTLRLWSDEPQDGQLRITIYGNVTRRAFLLYNTHSLPLPCPPAEVPPLFGKTRGFEIAGLTITATIGGPATFRIDYDALVPDLWTEQTVEATRPY